MLWMKLGPTIGNCNLKGLYGSPISILVCLLQNLTEQFMSYHILFYLEKYVCLAFAEGCMSLCALLEIKV